MNRDDVIRWQLELGANAYSAAMNAERLMAICNKAYVAGREAERDAARLEGWQTAREQAAKVADNLPARWEGNVGMMLTKELSATIRAMQPPAEWQCVEVPPVCGAAPNAELAFDDIERLREALTWMGYATPESGEERAARWIEMVRDLIRAVLDKKRRALAQVADAHAVQVAEPWPHPDGFAGGLTERNRDGKDQKG